MSEVIIFLCQALTHSLKTKKEKQKNCFKIFTLPRVVKTPSDLRSQYIVIPIITTLRIVLIVPSIGIYLLTSHRITPTATNTNKIVKSGMIFSFLNYNIIFKFVYPEVV